MLVIDFYAEIALKWRLTCDCARLEGNMQNDLNVLSRPLLCVFLRRQSSWPVAHRLNWIWAGNSQVWQWMERWKAACVWLCVNNTAYVFFFSDLHAVPQYRSVFFSMNIYSAPFYDWSCTSGGFWIEAASLSNSVFRLSCVAFLFNISLFFSLSQVKSSAVTTILLLWRTGFFFLFPLLSCWVMLLLMMMMRLTTI